MGILFKCQRKDYICKFLLTIPIAASSAIIAEIVSEIVKMENVEIVTKIYLAVIRDLYGNDVEYHKSDCLKYLKKYKEFKDCTYTLNV